MREMIDCHVHTARCGHAKGSAVEYVEAAIEKGVATLVFAEHLPLPDDLDPDRRLSLPIGELEEYASEVLALAESYREIQVVLGAEVDWLEDRQEYMLEMIDRARGLGVAYFLGSVHFLGSWAFDSPHELERWGEVAVDDVYERYFSQWCVAASSGLFDCMAHPDLPKKFGHRPTRDAGAWYESAASCAALGGTAIEVSTAGIRKPVGEIYPAPSMLSAFFSAGVEATVGSDAHEPAEVGYGLSQAYAALTDAGYTYAVCPNGGGKWRKVMLDISRG